MDPREMMHVVKELREAATADSLEQAQEICGTTLEEMMDSIDCALDGDSVKSTGLLEEMARAEVLIVIGNLLRQMTKLTQSLDITEDDETPPVWPVSSCHTFFASAAAAVAARPFTVQLRHLVLLFHPILSVVGHISCCIRGRQDHPKCRRSGKRDDGPRFDSCHVRNPA